MDKEFLETLKNNIDGWLGTESIIKDNYLLIPNSVNKWAIMVILHDTLRLEGTGDFGIALDDLDRFDLLENYNGENYYALIFN